MIGRGGRELFYFLEVCPALLCSSSFLHLLLWKGGNLSEVRKVIFNIIYFSFNSNYLRFSVEITLPGNIPSSVKRNENTPSALNWWVQKTTNNTMSAYPLATENRSVCFIKMPSFLAGMKGNVSCLRSPVKVLLLRWALELASVRSSLDIGGWQLLVLAQVQQRRSVRICAGMDSGTQFSRSEFIRVFARKLRVLEEALWSSSLS